MHGKHHELIISNIQGIAEHLSRAGYETHAYGKWDVGKLVPKVRVNIYNSNVYVFRTKIILGMATHEHIPAGRGYRNSLIYYHHVNDAWNMVAYQVDGL